MVNQKQVGGDIAQKEQKEWENNIFTGSYMKKQASRGGKTHTIN